MFCKNCGHNIAPSEQVCPFCAEKSGFPKGMVGESELLPIKEAKDMIGDVSLSADSYGDAPVTPAPRKNDVSARRPVSDDQPTTVFSVSEVNKALNKNAAVNGEYNDYDEYYDDEYYDDEYYDGAKKAPLPFTQRQIMIGGGAILVVLLIIILLLLSKCGNDGSTLPSSSTEDTAVTSSENEVSSQPTSSNPLSESAISFTSSAVPTSSTPTSSATSSEASSNVSSETSSAVSSSVSSSVSSETSSAASSETPSEAPSTTPSESSSRAPEDIGEDEGINPDA